MENSGKLEIGFFQVYQLELFGFSILGSIQPPANPTLYIPIGGLLG